MSEIIKNRIETLEHSLVIISVYVEAIEVISNLLEAKKVDLIEDDPFRDTISLVQKSFEKFAENQMRALEKIPTSVHPPLSDEEQVALDTFSQAYASTQGKSVLVLREGMVPAKGMGVGLQYPNILVQLKGGSLIAVLPEAVTIVQDDDDDDEEVVDEQDENQTAKG